MEGRGSSRAYLARNPLTASRNVPAAPPSPAGGNPSKSLASTRVLALFSGRLFTTISPSPAVGSPQICLPPSPPSPSSSNQIGTRVRVCGGGGYEIKKEGGDGVDSFEGKPGRVRRVLQHRLSETNPGPT
uniref:Uncharacterized protein n=1 Tax=Oryza brachyantha TaxID=4533 RepID=J3L6D7_ORYBR